MAKDEVEVRPARVARGWYITAQNRTLVRGTGGAIEVPYGVGHMRKLGSRLTACGLPALNWPIFWGLELDAEALCAECRWTVRFGGGA